MKAESKTELLLIFVETLSNIYKFKYLIAIQYIS